MAYSKTTWQNNVTDVDANNLNKIEQGIYDNSLVVDAVTDTLNPTDTETYKTAELTEGQITDVIGVNDILIKGQTSQNGEPTPSSPVDINVVSGSNVINTSNKNLFIPTLRYNNRDINQNNCIVTLNKDEFNFVASGADMYFGHIGSTGTTFVDTYGVLYKVLNNKTIRFTITNTTFNKNYIVKYDKDKKILGYQQFNSNSGTITFTDDVKYYSFRIGYGSAVAGTTYKTKIQVELGSTATTYEQHQGKELLLDLLVENLLNLPDGTYSNNGVTAIVTNGIITLNGTASGTSAINIPINITIKANQAYTLEANNLSVIGQGGTGGTYSCIRFRTSDTDDSNTDVRFNPINNYITFQKTAETTYAYLRIRTGDGLTYNNFIIKPQLELSSKANAYTPYGTDPIELCKIGNYQDYFYKSGSKWYLHREIERLVLGDYDWTLANNTSISNINTNRWYITHSCSRLPNNSAKVIMSNILPMGTANSTYGQDELLIGQSTSQSVIRMPVEYTTASAIKTALQDLNAYAYVLKNEATNTEITDTTLISQLEAIYNAPLYEETNITQINNDLPMVLDITACKDNINGIKAFIRK